MALFNRLFLALIFLFQKRGKFSSRELVFNRTKLQADMMKNMDALNDYRADQSHRIFVDYLRNLLNLEILRMAEGRPSTPESVAVQRGRIEGLRHALDFREKFIEDKKVQKETKAPAGTRSYVRSPATTAGLSI